MSTNSHPIYLTKLNINQSTSAMESIAILQKGKGLTQGIVTLPPLKEHQGYVKVEYAAFNPTDRKFGRQPSKFRVADLLKALLLTSTPSEMTQYWAVTSPVKWWMPIQL